jgi:serine/threonine protein kinase
MTRNAHMKTPILIHAHTPYEHALIEHRSTAQQSLSNTHYLKPLSPLTSYYITSPTHPIPSHKSVSFKLVKCIEDNRLFALKTIFTEKESDMKDTLREVRFLRQNRHPCIIDVHDGFMTSQPRMLFIVMPYCEGGDLDALLKTTKKNKQFLPEEKILKWTTQVGLAMHFLHEKGVIHRDLKPNNVMLTEGGDLIKVVDFGLAMATNEVGTIIFMLSLHMDVKIIIKS